ncbi:MAG: ATP-binding cassette domain-containing protein [Deltaproteobacteria bacterium]|nr:ATP-binding cassette domain-containing protein [Deltaproteobacteria bacterium]
MIKVENVSKFYGSFKALNNISFEINSGEVVGFLGPNGAGKTTTLKILTCNSLPHSGSISVGGHDVLTSERLVQKAIGYLPESAPVYKEMLVREYLTFMGQVRGLKGKKLREAVDKVSMETGITEKMSSPVAHLSKGYRQRVGLAQALIHTPEVLILDEPYTGLDPIQIIEIRNLIKNYGKKHTVILSSHILQEVEATCSRVLIINNGEIVADSPTEKLLSKNTVMSGIIGPDPEIRKAFSEIKAVNYLGDEVVSENEKSILKIRLSSDTISKDELSELVFNTCTKNSWKMISLGEGRITFEDLFISLTGKSQKKGASK